MKDIMLKIKGTQTGLDSKDGEPEVLEFITEGKLYKRGNAYYILYEESELSGMPGCKTTLKYTDSLLRMKRSGNKVGVYTVLEFGEGRTFNSSYFTPYGDLDLKVKTNSFRNEFDEAGMGKLFVDYDLILRGMVEARNTIDITVANNLEELQQLQPN